MSAHHLSASSRAGRPFALLPRPDTAGVISSELDRAYAGIRQLAEALVPLFAPQDLSGKVFFTIQPGRGRSFGWFWKERWKLKDTEGYLPEINIAAEFLGRGLHEIAETVLHEMVHYANWKAGVEDCSASQYHKVAFRRRAEEVGLICGPWDKAKGWARTRPSPRLVEIVDNTGIEPEAFSAFRPEMGAGRKKATPKRVVWACAGSTEQCCPVAIPTGKRWQAVCLSCNTQFMKR